MNPVSKTHYDTLGISRESTPQEIRSAYRKLVLKHHPDRSSDPHAAALFRRIVEAYEVLTDPERRASYDVSLSVRQNLREKIDAPAPTPAPATPRQAPKVASRGEDMTRLQELLNRGKLGEAEKLATELKQKHPREPLPYAVIGDMARSRGDVRSAMLHYSHALQMDPRNAVYLRKYEDLFKQGGSTPTGSKLRLSPLPIVVGGILLAGILVSVSLTADAKPLFPDLGLIDTWNLPLVLALFFGGVVMGVALAAASLIDRFEAVAHPTLGRISPAVALCTVAVFNFWVAAGLYAALGVYQGSLNYSTSRLVASTGALVIGIGFAAMSGGLIELSQVALWGGNLVYLGAVSGWIVADAMRPTA